MIRLAITLVIEHDSKDECDNQFPELSWLTI
jgi:hypothetical protein